MDLAEEGRRHPKQAATCLARFCTCGVFNPVRAELVLEEARVGKPEACLGKRQAEYVLRDVPDARQGPLTARLGRRNMAIGQNRRV